jgi:uracil-DNA glycosylase
LPVSRARRKTKTRVSIGPVEKLEEHRARVLSCTRCFPGLSGTAAPVVDLPKVVRAMLVAQAPGSTETVTRLPFTGPAGKRLAGWFERAGISREEIYLSAIARCFPGKARGGGDLVPSRPMIRNCRTHLAREIQLLKPEVIVPVGGLAIKELLGIGRLSDAVGEEITRDGITYVPLPHPSGASTWLNRLENKERLGFALGLLAERMAVLRQRRDTGSKKL